MVLVDTSVCIFTHCSLTDINPYLTNRASEHRAIHLREKSGDRQIIQNQGTGKLYLLQNQWTGKLYLQQNPPSHMMIIETYRRQIKWQE